MDVTLSRNGSVPWPYGFGDLSDCSSAVIGRRHQDQPAVTVPVNRCGDVDSLEFVGTL
jgi:hypothetical protein